MGCLLRNESAISLEAEDIAMADHFDLLVLGSGEAGKYIAWAFASEGKKVACIERQWVGGSCPNVACLPSKNFVHSAEMVHQTQEAIKSGIFSDVDIKVNMSAVRARKREMVDGLVAMHKDRFVNSGAQLIEGNGRFIEPKKIQVTDPKGEQRVLTGETVIISTGSRANIDSVPGLAEAKPLTHIDILELDKVPSHLIVLGAGYVGLEFAQIMRRLGAKVTVIDRNDRILKREDEDVSTELEKLLAAEGIQFCLSSSISGVKGTSGDTVSVKVMKAGKTSELQGSHILCATGRIPNTDGIGLEEPTNLLTKNGFVKVDDHLQTVVPGVFAVGDCAGSPHFTHVSFSDFRIVKDFLKGLSANTTGRQVPYTLFTSPELAHIGAHEHELKAKDVKYRKAQLPMAAFLRTRTLADTRGFAKVMVSESDQILGFTALGPGAGELLPVVQLAMKAGLPYTAIRDLVVTHPTLSEGLVYLFMAVPPR
ncbi:hypothetical protein H2198_000233 [Neophaeococcomyces mojaviensis]|uniref:Uncharacterized protein n=1 Tax=Neophaeococcomyces mojaviensis TaxID=3383035 RepID=A0ACC3AKP0_9EURO|nr:hypothetical protein H2198_000233 [Knufia sp. JES_112]